jgi:hypothetical protein
MLMIQIPQKREKRRVSPHRTFLRPKKLGFATIGWRHALPPEDTLRLESSDLVAATDLERARVFYEQTLSLRVLERSDFAVVLDANGTMLRVTAVGQAAHAGYTVLGWQVRAITVSVRALAARGVVFLRYEGMSQDDAGIWTSPLRRQSGLVRRC